jgi:predicted nucleic acid-binding protein
MIAVDSSVLIDILNNSARAEVSEAALRRALEKGPVVMCDVVVAEVCSALMQPDEVQQTLEELGIQYLPMKQTAAARAGEMQKRYRDRKGKYPRVLPDFLVGAHAMMQCEALITHDGEFVRDYFKGLKVIVPSELQ